MDPVIDKVLYYNIIEIISLVVITEVATKMIQETVHVPKPASVLWPYWLNNILKILKNFLPDVKR